MQYNRWFTFLRIGYIDVYLANLYTMVAAIADIRIENYWGIRCRYIRDSINLILCHVRLLLAFVNSRIIIVVGFIVFFEITAIVKG